MATVNLLGIGEISVPVLLLFGDEDAVFTGGAADNSNCCSDDLPIADVGRHAGYLHHPHGSGTGRASA